MRIAVTGSSGFIGTNLMLELVRLGHDCLGLDRLPARHPVVDQNSHQVDVKHTAEGLRLLREFAPDVVVHLAARTDLSGQGLSAYSDNTTGTLSVVEMVRSLPQPAYLIHASSRLVFDPTKPATSWDYTAHTWYGESKVASELVVRASDVSWTIVRPTSIWGPYFGVPYRGFFEAVTRGRYVHASSTAVRKTMGFVGNTVHQLVTLCEKRAGAGQALFLGDEDDIDILEWANAIAARSSARGVPLVPITALKAAATAGSAFQTLSGVQAPLTRFRLANIYESVTYDCSPIHAIAGPDPFGLVAGVDRTLQWLRASD